MKWGYFQCLECLELCSLQVALQLDLSFLFGLFQTAVDINFGDGGSTAYNNNNVPFVGNYLTDG